MTLWLISFGLTVAFFILLAPFNIVYHLANHPPLFALIIHALALAHFFIGDLFHWARFPQLRTTDRFRLVLLAGVGGLLFFILRGTAHFVSLLIVYFLAHFWKEFDLRVKGEMDQTARVAHDRIKRWCGLMVVSSFAVLCSGLVIDPMVLALAKRVVWGLATIIVVGMGGQVMRDRRPVSPHTRLSLAYGSLTVIWLVVFTWCDVTHPLNLTLRYFFLLSHFIYWYLFYLTRQRVGLVAISARAGNWVARLKQTPAAMIPFIIAVNLAALAGAWTYQRSWSGHPGLFPLLDGIYDPGFRAVLGCWTVLHVTWNWPSKYVQGVHVGF